ncbi:O-antigen ligase family protein [Anaerosinus massiliensis]|uniref:O-antigen ligase family protein n=1 Tax=Massilibacillus massiliensis TaxID=1806837 RepID=UPI000DA5F117|nr:O-antigen ligase family protein [Massilibacillus massiliensis]
MNTKRAEILDTVIYYIFLVYMVTICWTELRTNFLGYIILILGIIRYYFSPIKIKLQTYHIWILVIFFICKFSTIFLNDVNANYYTNFQWFRDRFLSPILILFLLIYFVREKEKIKNLFFALVISFLIGNLFAIGEFYQGGSRVSGLTTDTMELAGFLIMLYPSTIIFLFKDQLAKRCKIILYLCLIVSTPVIFFNGTRIAWVILALTIPSILILLMKNKKMLITILLIVLASTSMLINNNDALQKRFYSITDHNYQSNAERVRMWKSAWNMFSDHPIAGVGLGNYMEQYRTKYILPEAKERNQWHAHNVFMQTLAESGIIGILPYICMVVYFTMESFIRWIRTKDLMSLLFLCVTLGFFLHGMTDVNLGNLRILFKIYCFFLGMYLITNDLIIYNEKETIKNN